MDKRKTFIIIQARMRSMRLPGKILLPVGKISALEIMMERLEPLRKKFKIIIATTNDGSEAPIVALCDKMNVSYYRGDVDNVLSRYYEAALKFGAKDDDVIARITSDCQLIDPDITAQVVEFYKKHDFDFVSNAIEKTYPHGLDVTVFPFSLLKLCMEKSTTDFEKEHVTAYVDTTHTEEFRFGSFKDSEDNSKYRITLDYEDDYKVICEIYKLFNYRTDFKYGELIKLLRENPYIHEMNRHLIKDH